MFTFEGYCIGSFPIECFRNDAPDFIEVKDAGMFFEAKKSSKIPETFERRWFDLLQNEISKLVVFDL